MTHDERISSYIDNEFSTEQEQEFLISLAASEGLRKSFRSELVLKKVLHHDEAVMNPPRKLRGAVFASLGLAGVGLSVNKANATQSASHGMLRAFFATKMSALVTVAGLSISALAGYGVHSIVSPEVPQIQPATHVMQSVSPNVQQMPVTSSIPETSAVPIAQEVKHVARKSMSQHHQINPSTNAVQEPVNGAVGSGTVTMEPPKINPAH
jgi:hypothetical protein